MKAIHAFLISLAVAIATICMAYVDADPQHAEFLRVFFVELPKTLVERCFSAFL